MTLVLAAIVHDMGHDGRNNAFHINIHDDLALTYNDMAVLENFHASQAFKLLVHDPDTNVMAGLGKSLLGRARKDIIDMILATDMSQHFAKLGSFSTMLEKLWQDVSAWRREERTLDALRSMVLHACDISGQAKPVVIGEIWSNRVMSEFFVQGDQEKSLGLPVSPLCDRDTTDIPHSQVGFIQFIVQPTFETFAGLVPKVEAVCLERISENRTMWAERKKRAQADEL